MKNGKKEKKNKAKQKNIKKKNVDGDIKFEDKNKNKNETKKIHEVMTLFLLWLYYLSQKNRVPSHNSTNIII